MTISERAQKLLRCWRALRQTYRYQIIWEFERYAAMTGNSLYSELECYNMVMALRAEGFDLLHQIDTLRKDRKAKAA